MGGEKEFKESDLRTHKGDKDGKVHIHDDKAGVKFVMPIDEFTEKYAILKNETLKSNFGLMFDETGNVELHARLENGQVKFQIRNKVKGFEKFDSFVSEVAKA